MVYKISGMVVFLCLCCILTVGGANDESLSLEKRLPFEWSSMPLHWLTLAGNKFLWLGKGSGQPIDIESRQSATKNILGGDIASFEGNVKVKQGDVSLTCDRLVIVYDGNTGDKTAQSRIEKLHLGMQDADRIEDITASGNVKIVQNDWIAMAGKALYDNAKRTITLAESPSISNGKDTLVARTFIILLDENRIVTPVEWGPIYVFPNETWNDANVRYKE